MIDSNLLVISSELILNSHEWSFDLHFPCQEGGYIRNIVSKSWRLLWYPWWSSYLLILPSPHCCYYCFSYGFFFNWFQPHGCSMYMFLYINLEYYWQGEFYKMTYFWKKLDKIPSLQIICQNDSVGSIYTDSTFLLTHTLTRQCHVTSSVIII